MDSLLVHLQNNTKRGRLEMKEIKSYNFEELKLEMKEIGEKPFRAKQIYDWLHVQNVTSFDEMSNLSKALREKLAKEYDITHLRIEQRQVSKDDNTNKFLFELKDGHLIESVYMPYKHGNSVCISSQVGCAMGCKFCASGLDGLARNLTTAEMLSQIYEIQRITGTRISNIVLMGSGEPLHNYENFVKFIRMISDDKGLNISQRNITVSTVGLAPNIRKVAEEGFQITLAFSLHGSNQEKRKTLIPIANKFPLEDVLKACDYYYDKTGRRLTFEYSLVAGVNDTAEDAVELGKMLRGKNCHVNLIPVNPIKEREFVQPSKKAAQDFKNKLEKSGINVTIRREMGADIDGACGQLRRRHIEKNN